MKTAPGVLAALLTLAASVPIAHAQEMDHSGMEGMTMPSPAPSKETAPTKHSDQASPTAQKSKRPSVSHKSSTAPKAPSTGAPMTGMSMDQMDMSSQHDHSANSSASGDEVVGDQPAPPAPTDHAADRLFDPAAMAKARAQLHEEHGGSLASKFMLNLGEYQIRNGKDGYRWDAEGWFGGDIHRAVLKTEGEGTSGSRLENAEVQILYSRAVAPYLDLQAGVRQDFDPTPRRTYGTLGFEWLAPYWFQVDGAAFLSTHGELLGRLGGSYDLLLTQRWVLQPRIELNFSARNIPERDIGNGLSNAEMGLRLRYEIRRDFAPYVGITFEQKVGRTADYARLRGEDTSQFGVVMGIRSWF